MEEGHVDFNRETGSTMNGILIGAYRLFPKDPLYVDLDRLIRQLLEPEKGTYSERLHFAVSQFTTSLESPEGGLEQE